ncbi:MAG: hypothetical protein GX101_09650 [Firmicutes bacterium]|mgnify:CR=1 FL=1|jgi:hypothetical protein|nr:hypothetical protein [Bacillota bacterium]
MKRKLVLLLFVAVFLVGCSSYQREMVPPKVDLGSSRRIAVLFFDNLTDDYALVYEVEQQLVEQLGVFYQVTDPREADWALARVGLRPTEAPSAEQARRLGELLGVDAVIMGEVSGYFEPINQTPPYIVKTRETEDGKIENLYEVTRTTTVLLSFTGRAISTKSGNMIYRERVQSEKVVNSKVSLRWFPQGKEPTAWDVPTKSRIDVPEARRAAVHDAVAQFVEDLLPTYVWRRVQ